MGVSTSDAAIAQQPQNATVIVGETATFTVMASGSGVTYEWQSMPPGATDSSIAGASSSTYTTPPIALADSGTQFRCVVSNGLASVTSNAVTLTVVTGSPFVLSDPVGILRNNFSGWVGMRFTVGSSPLSISALGRICVAGNSGTHTIKLVNTSSGTDVARRVEPD